MKKLYISSKVIAVGLLAVLVLASQNAVAGRGDKAGTSAAPELLIPVGARDIALGGASVATSTGVEAIYWNPAGLSRSSFSSEAMFSHMSYIADIGVEYVALGANFGFGSIGFTLKSLSIGTIAITDEDNPDGTGETFVPTYFTLGLTYSRLLTDRISVGFTTNLISERIDRVSATGVAFNAGIQYSDFANVNGLLIGVTVKNVGPAMKFDGPGLLREGNVNDVLRPQSFYKIEAASDELPSIIELGVGYQYKFQEQNVFTFTSLFQNNNYSDDEYKLGLEYAYDNTIFLRGGYTLSQETIKDSHIYGPTAGVGLQYAFTGLTVAFDYAFRSVEFLSSNHVFALKLGF